MNATLASIGATVGATLMETTANLVRRLPRAWRYPIASALGFLFGRVARQMRSALRENIERLLNQRSADADRLCDQVFRNFALTLLDFFVPEDVSVDVPARPVIERLRAAHPGCLVLTFHLGHWELGARTMQRWGWPVTAVYQPYRNKKFKRVIESRRAPGVEFLPVGGAAAAGVRAALAAGRVVAMLGDHPFGEEGVTVSLLGHRVRWPKGPVVLAVREGTPIVVAAIVRTAPGTYEAIVEEPMIPTARNRAEVERLVQSVADKFGKLLTRFPEQWYRFRPLEFVERHDDAVPSLVVNPAGQYRR